jgi:hypothetical protein
VTIKTSDQPNTPFSLTVLTSTGQISTKEEVKNATNSYELNTQRLTEGLYIVKVRSAHRLYTKKLMIKR